MTQSISLLGSTGSIGTQTLEVCRHLGIRVAALTCGHHLNTLERQIREFLPELVSVAREEDALDLKNRLAGEFPGWKSSMAAKATWQPRPCQGSQP